MSVPGSNDYLRTLLETIKQQRPDVDARLFTAILLCLVAGERNLLVRTEEDNVADVAATSVDVSHLVNSSCAYP